MLEEDVKKETLVRKEKQKVWAKLRNGLYGWRVSYKVKKCLGTEADVKPSTPEQRPPSATGKKKSQGVPARGQHLFKTMLQEIASKEISNFKTGIFGIKRKSNYNFGDGSLSGGEESKSLEISGCDERLMTKKT